MSWKRRLNPFRNDAAPMSSPLQDPAKDAALRLLVLCDRPAASQEVHLFRPLRRLRATGACALTIYSEDNAAAARRANADWITQALHASGAQALILSRFAGPDAGAAIAAARAAGVPSITHLDDYLLEVPPDLGADKQRLHMRPERIAALTASLAEADLLYISTPILAGKIRGAGFATPAIVSELQSCADPSEIAPPPDDGAAIRIGYQGTRNHIHDLRMITPALLAAMEARPNTILSLFGTIEPPKELLKLGARLTHLPPAADYTAFLAALAAQRWHIGLAPLRPIEFNSFRTYTKWTEYSIAGAAVLASDNPAYRPVMSDGAGRLVAGDAWAEALIALIDDSAARHAMIARAQDMLRNTLSLARQEEQVLSMLRQAMGE